MLVLTRKRHESIVIGEQIKITVVDVRGDRVRLGFEAPPEIRIDREEIARRRADGGPAAEPGGRAAPGARRAGQ